VKHPDLMHATQVEGMVAKDPESKYRGGRKLSWLKVKVPEYRVKERGFYDPDR